MPKFISFDEQIQDPKRKTKTFEVRAANNGAHLGEVKWFGAWRCYGFFPDDQTIYEKQCLRDIADFCEQQTNDHRAKGKTCPSSP